MCSSDLSRIRIAATADGRELTIEDDGPGISEVDLERVRLRGESDGTAPDNAGLGLAIVGDIASAYGFALDLGRSQRLGGLRARLDFRPEATGSFAG